MQLHPQITHTTIAPSAAANEINLSVLNGMFGTLGMTQQSQQNQQPPPVKHHQPIVAHQNGYNNYLNGNNGRNGHHSKDSTNPSNSFAAAAVPPSLALMPSEKINDIYVNRNIGQLYGPIITHITPSPKKPILLYDDMNASYKGFYLHNPRRDNFDTSLAAAGDTKVYNAFSKQRQPYVVERNAEIPIDQFVRSSALRKQQQPVWRSVEAAADLEDDELANILGYVKRSLCVFFKLFYFFFA